MLVNSLSDDITNMIFLSQVNSLTVCGPQVDTLLGLSVQPSLEKPRVVLDLDRTAFRLM